jgi:uncharacterized protein YbaA (DUF1428 family)
MGRYVDGFVIPIAKKNLAAYRRIAALGGKIWKEHGALEYVECVGEELTTEMMGAPFVKMCGLKRGETVVFSWICYRNKAHRNKVNAAVMRDPRMKPMMGGKKMPFDFKRMAMAGFKTIVES